MAEFTKITRTGSTAVNSLSTAPLPHCQPNIILGNPGGGFFCGCEELKKLLLQITSEASISKGGCIALLALAGTFVGRVWAKYRHKEGDMSCYTYRKIKDMVTHQPWFCIPLITVPVINYHRPLTWRPPLLTYVLLVGGWMLNTTGHVFTIATKDDRLRKITVPASYASLALAGVVSLLAVLVKNSLHSC